MHLGHTLLAAPSLPQVTRRMMNQGITRGFTAWHELWAAKTHAISRLREVGNRLRAPEKAVAFKLWLQAAHDARQTKMLRELAAKEAGLQGQALGLAEQLAAVTQVRHIHLLTAMPSACAFLRACPRGVPSFHSPLQVPPPHLQVPCPPLPSAPTPLQVPCPLRCPRDLKAAFLLALACRASRNGCFKWRRRRRRHSRGCGLSSREARRR